MKAGIVFFFFFFAVTKKRELGFWCDYMFTMHVMFIFRTHIYYTCKYTGHSTLSSIFYYITASLLVDYNMTSYEEGHYNKSHTSDNLNDVLRMIGMADRDGGW